MTDRDGTPIWYDLMTDAPDAAQDFYARVMGWRFEASQGAPGRDYRIFTATDGEGIGGMMQMPAGAALPPMWAVYFGVSDVDAMAARVRTLGGAIHIPPQDIPGVGRFAFVADPQGARFYLMRGDGAGHSTAYAPALSGHCSWNELVTRDQNAALAFYGALFGWEKSGAMPMGETGEYTFVRAGDTDIGAMMNDDADPCWGFAFNVPDIDTAKVAVEEGGGTITLGPTELPTDGDWLIQGSDAQGARVMFSGPRRAGV